jgi:hypothetical protein
MTTTTITDLAFEVTARNPGIQPSPTAGPSVCGRRCG